MNDLFEKPKPKRKKINPLGLKSSDIGSAMAKQWSEPEYAIMWEVNEGTGHNTGRSADAVIMSLWPSRGLELHGVEIKVSRSDWKREAADPTKAEAIAKYCDRWWIHTPEGVVGDISDVPPAWGLREYDGKRWVTLREATLNPSPEPMNRRFLAALLRRADGMMKRMVYDATEAARNAAHAEGERLREQHRDSVKREVARITLEMQQGKDALAELETAFGAKITDWSITPKTLGLAAKALHDCHKAGWNGPTHPEKLRTAADHIETLQALLNPPTGG